MPHSRCLVLVSKYLIYLLISNKYAVFSFEICNKAIKQVALSESQVFIAILSSILNFQAGYVHIQCIKGDVFSVNKNVLNYILSFC